MANLIITIISIALVAVMAIAGIYYGGQAFNEAQAKAKANTIVRGLEQIAAALIARRTMAGPQAPIGISDTDNLGGLTGLTPTYLSSFPALPEDVADVTFAANGSTFQSGWGRTSATVVDGLGTTLGYRIVLYVVLKDNALAEKVCRTVNATQGINTVPAIYPSNASDPGYYNWYVAYKNYRVHCQFRDPDNDGNYSYSAGTEYYRISLFVN